MEIKPTRWNLELGFFIRLIPHGINGRTTEGGREKEGERQEFEIIINSGTKKKRIEEEKKKRIQHGARLI